MGGWERGAIRGIVQAGGGRALKVRQVPSGAPQPRFSHISVVGQLVEKSKIPAGSVSSSLFLRDLQARSSGERDRPRRRKGQKSCGVSQALVLLYFGQDDEYPTLTVFKYRALTVSTVRGLLGGRTQPGTSVPYTQQATSRYVAVPDHSSTLLGARAIAMEYHTVNMKLSLSCRSGDCGIAVFLKFRNRGEGAL